MLMSVPIGILRWITFGLMLASFVLGYQAWRMFQNVHIIIEWSTGSELDTAGFNLYRSTELDGSFERINPELIPPAMDSLQGGMYQYIDDTIEANQIYYYRLEEVEFSGQGNIYDIEGVEAERDGILPGFLAILLLFSVGVLFLENRRLHPKSL